MADSNTPFTEEIPSADDLFKALTKTTHFLHRQFEMQLSSFDVPEYLTGPRLRVLIAVSESGKIRMSDLASKLGIKARTVTQFVDALEQKNLLIRLPDPNDRRATFLQVTDIAAPLIKNARSATNEVTEKLFEPLPMELRIQLLNILSRLVDYRNVCIFDDKEQ
ncbi:MarR family transcriptional regulator [Brevibacillus ruminantium]|uniref:MarR family transcriptional regulator n=1 Tax=Brevibacillus ruminantium TaxID=2950604 RepID=A0ABY4WLX6_9BACL|nr:MarR family transcriptional regulator [Brevibacillus ruminantium]USG68160.1 MarR family transcriptional regulator [Brevibacillus ruminantium]